MGEADEVEVCPVSLVIVFNVEGGEVHVVMAQHFLIRFDVRYDAVYGQTEHF